MQQTSGLGSLMGAVAKEELGEGALTQLGPESGTPSSLRAEWRALGDGLVCVRAGEPEAQPDFPHHHSCPPEDDGPEEVGRVWGQ